MRIKSNIIIIFLIAMCIPSILVNAKENGTSGEVSIIVLSDAVVYSDEVKIEYEIVTNNRDILNNCYVSYHIYTEKGDVICYDNERIALNNVDDKIVGKLSFSVAEKALNSKEKYVIELDILDLDNEIWFSEKENIAFENAKVLYQYDRMKVFANVYIQAFKKSPIIAIINIIVFLSTIIGLIYIKKHSEF